MHAGRCNDGDSVVANVPLEKKKQTRHGVIFLKKKVAGFNKADLYSGEEQPGSQTNVFRAVRGRAVPCRHLGVRKSAFYRQ